MDPLTGLIAREVNTGAVTLRLAEPLIEPELAVMMTDPCAELVANPLLLTVATGVAEEIHVELPVRFCVVPSLYVPVAANCCDCPAATVAMLGVTEMEVSTAAVTVSVAEPLIVPELAVIVADPCAALVARPPLTVATDVAEEFQVALPVRLCVVPLL
jgi:hypothetical protein